MDTFNIWKLLVLTIFISGIYAELVVLNEINDTPLEELNFSEEYLIPVNEAAKRSSKAGQRSLSSVDQHLTKDITQDTHLMVEPEHNKNIELTANTYNNNKNVKKISQQEASTKSNSLSEKHDSIKADDDIDFEGEELLSVESKSEPRSSNGRKLAQFNEQVDTSYQNNIREHKNVEHMNSPDSSRQQQKLQEDFELQNTDNENDLAILNLKVACVYENSWECLMFKEDFIAMQGDVNLSRRATVHEREKRQSSSNYGNTHLRNNGNTRNLLGCEDGDCLSGGGNETGVEEVAPDFYYKSESRFPTNLTKDTLTNETKKELAKELADQLNEIFKNIPGFRNVTVDPSDVYISNGTVVIDWKVNIDGGNGNYTGLDGPGVGATINDAVRNANTPYKNITVGGQHPTTDLNITNLVDQVIKQANDPCKMTPSQCTIGYGKCERLPADYTNMNGIRLRCSDSCINFSDCTNHGFCDKDKIGNPFCNCSENWIGLFCDKENITTADPDEIVIPVYKISLTTVFKTNLTPEQLTPRLRNQIAKELADLLASIFQFLPGFKNVTINPNSITIRNGKLYVPSVISIASDWPQFTGLTPQQISDLMKSGLQNVSDSYRQFAKIDGESPIDDLDVTDMTDQVYAQASDPCLTDPCTIGYGHCEVINSSLVKCIHNCNALPGNCSNGGMCQLNFNGTAVCQCTSEWNGPNCLTPNPQQNVEAGVGKNPGKIVGIVLGSLLALAGILGLLWFLLCVKPNRQPIDFSDYTDNEAAGQAASLPKDICVINRPVMSYTPGSLFKNFVGSALYRPQSVHGASISSGSAIGNNAANSYQYSHA
uniref:EGF-like domain-containing protein n=1 Tax=Arion vulgaris TaxID=1028688 RepID=A0A0B7B7D6_9EUPU